MSKDIARDTACHSEYPSTSKMLPQTTTKLGDEEDCDTYWTYFADNILKNKLKLSGKLLEKTRRLKVKGKYCYRPDLFRNKGWCQIVDPSGSKIKNTWGFCSSSCKVEYMKVYISFN